MTFHRAPSLVAAILPVLLAAQDIALIPLGSTWKYRDNGSNQGTAWRATAFNDAAWASGPAELGYGDGDEATVVSYGSSSSNKYITTYFRKAITIPTVSAYAGFKIRIRRDDGAVVFVNGQEVLRCAFSDGTVNYNSLAGLSAGGADETLLREQLILSSYFQNGTNVIAVEIHQDAVNSSDISFDLELTGLDATAELFRGPYLHIVTPSSALVKWKTNVPSDSRVRYGTAPGALTNAVNIPALSTDHEVTVSGLQPNTSYYYAIGTSSGDLAGDDATTFFRTSPPKGGSPPVRIWAIGDAGTGSADQAHVRDAYMNYTGATPANAWIWLGDNAYLSGREIEFQHVVFKNMYEPVLRNTPLFPAPGNHDYYSGASAATNTGPYYDLFALPKNGEAGGVPSNTESYYSVDVGNVHLVSLDSHDSPRSATGAMATWLANDLNYAQANSEWIIVYWHHPPYTKGNHDSDDTGDPRSGDMRQNILPILESHGADLVLCGHSHTYERSYLINGHYGLSSTFSSATMGVNMASGRADGTGAYQKPGDLAANAGTVYTVCGVSGKKESGGSLNHPVMYMSTASQFGSMVIDVNGTSLAAKFINDVGTVVDHFDMVKQPSKIALDLNVLLEGPYDTLTHWMSDSLRAKDLIPLSQPYTGLFAQVGEGGGETIQPAILTVTGANAIVDWVFVELRDRSNPAQVVDTRSALVQRDGDVVDLDGISPLRLTMPIGSYHVAVRHRNHLAAMTNSPVPLNRIPTTIDLRAPLTATWGSEARKLVGNTMVLWSGNAIADNKIKYTGTGNDRDPILTRIGGNEPNNSVSGYFTDDTNLDGRVKYTGSTNDRDRLLVNIGSMTPNNQRVEQLP
jgi:hypothetical protein